MADYQSHTHTQPHTHAYTGVQPGTDNKVIHTEAWSSGVRLARCK